MECKLTEAFNNGKRLKAKQNEVERTKTGQRNVMALKIAAKLAEA